MCPTRIKKLVSFSNYSVLFVLLMMYCCYLFSSFLNIPSDSIDNIMDEDTFVHKYYHSMLEEIFNTSNLKLVW